MGKLQAFYYMFKGEKWYNSIISGTLIFIPLFLTSSILLKDDPTREFSTFMTLSVIRWTCWFLVMFFINGYCLFNANQRLFSLTQNTASWLKLKDITKAGIKFLGAHWLYSIPLFWILAILFFQYTTSISNGISISEHHITYSLATKYCNVIAIFIGVLIPIAFVSDLKFKTLFNIKRICAIIKNNFIGFLIYIIIATIDIYGLQHLQNLTMHTPVVTIPCASFLAYYIMLIKSDFLAQLNKNSTIK